MSDTVKMTRFAHFQDRVLGKWQFRDRIWYSIERPWLDNMPNVSCIPTASYSMIRVDSPRFGADSAYQGQLWEVAEVPGRSAILIHIANWAKDLQGCIGLGSSLMADLAGVGHSRTSITDFYALTKDIQHLTLDIATGPLLEVKR